MLQHKCTCTFWSLALTISTTSQPSNYPAETEPVINEEVNAKRIFVFIELLMKIHDSILQFWQTLFMDDYIIDSFTVAPHVTYSLTNYTHSFTYSMGSEKGRKHCTSSGGIWAN